MDIVLYESSSRGGNFDYSQQLFMAYSNHKELRSVEWIIPSSSELSGKGIRKILRNDRGYASGKLVSRLSFLYRSLINPLKLFGYLFGKKSTRFVILNDFEQTTAFFWVPLYRLFLSRHYFAVMLHDPDRDAYPPSRRFSEMSMKKMMSIMSFGLFHERLPDKPYYRPNGKTQYLSVPHGQYDQQQVNAEMMVTLQSRRNGCKLVSIPGNIRMEKNYEIAIQATAKIPGIRLIIAGLPSSSAIDVDDLRRMAADLNIIDRVIFVIKYLSVAEMCAVIKSSDVILLNYKRTFASQSGIFNLIAPFKKTIIISQTESGLATTAAKYNIGHFVDPDDPDDLVRVLTAVLDQHFDDGAQWNEYLRYASWENHVNIVLDALKNKYADVV
ncbi:MAG: glycosyltransferase [Bacteroidota bacterium]